MRASTAEEEEEEEEDPSAIGPVFLESGRVRAFFRGPIVLVFAVSGDRSLKILRDLGPRLFIFSTNSYCLIDKKKKKKKI